MTRTAARPDPVTDLATPAPLATALAERLHLHSSDAEILEPSAGDGALVRALRRLHPDARIDAVEPNLSRWASIPEYGEQHGEKFSVSFEAFAALTPPGRYDAVVMHPPLTGDGHPVLWAEHVGLALTLLRPGGHLLAIVPASYRHSTHATVAALRARINGHVLIDTLPDDTFRMSGTLVKTVLLDVTTAP